MKNTRLENKGRVNDKLTSHWLRNIARYRSHIVGQGTLETTAESSVQAYP
jgi:phosphoribosylaminoimidazole-succinocarboxamide synthase